MPLVATQLNVANLGISAWDGDSGCLCFPLSSHWWSSSDWETDALHWKQKKKMLNVPHIHFKCRIHSVYDKNRNHCDISSFWVILFVYSVCFGLLADIYRVFSFSCKCMAFRGRFVRFVLRWHVVAACNVFCHGNLLKDTKSIKKKHSPGTTQ